jgi:Arylsulfatase A and related enzymes
MGQCYWNKTYQPEFNKKHKKGILAEMEYLDEQIGKLISTLKKAGKYDNTMIIITSDHGQAINEHGYMLHSTYLYDELVRIPLIIKYPNGKKFEAKKGYQNLVYLPKLIKDVLEGGDDSLFTLKLLSAKPTVQLLSCLEDTRIGRNT